MPADSTNRLLFTGRVVAIGEFRCRPGHPAWTAENNPGGYLVVFPRVPVLIMQADRDPVVADANQVMFYNEGRPYRRARICDAGDECEYFVLDPALAAEAVRAHDPRAADARELFAFAHGPGDPGAYVAQRLIYEHVRAGGAIDPLGVEEGFIGVLERVVADAFRARGRRAASAGATRADTRAARADLAESAKSLLARDPVRAPSLTDLSDALGVSPYHLCRVFRAHTGLTLSRYRDRLRLRATLAPLAEGGRDIGAIGLDAGYSSHSHFTDAFRREFGVPPSGYRARVRGRASNLAEGTGPDPAVG